MTTLNKSVQDMLNDNGDEPLSNHSANAHMNTIVNKRFSRRSLLQSIMGATAVSFMGASLTGCGGDDNDEGGAVAAADTLNATPQMSFKAIATSGPTASPCRPVTSGHRWCHGAHRLLAPTRTIAKMPAIPAPKLCNRWA